MAVLLWQRRRRAFSWIRECWCWALTRVVSFRLQLAPQLRYLQTFSLSQFFVWNQCDPLGCNIFFHFLISHHGTIYRISIREDQFWQSFQFPSFSGFHLGKGERFGLWNDANEQLVVFLSVNRFMQRCYTSKPTRSPATETPGASYSLNIKDRTLS